VNQDPSKAKCKNKVLYKLLYPKSFQISHQTIVFIETTIQKPTNGDSKVPKKQFWFPQK
jgi:hypothetical protein